MKGGFLQTNAIFTGNLMFSFLIIILDLLKNKYHIFTMNLIRNMRSLIKFKNIKHQMYQDQIFKRFNLFNLEIVKQLEQMKRSMA